MGDLSSFSLSSYDDRAMASKLQAIAYIDTWNIYTIFSDSKNLNFPPFTAHGWIISVEDHLQSIFWMNEWSSIKI